MLLICLMGTICFLELIVDCGMGVCFGYYVLISFRYKMCYLCVMKWVNLDS